MSADEYLRRAKELNDRERELDRQKIRLDADRKHLRMVDDLVRASNTINAAELAAVFAAAMEKQPPQQLRIRCASGGCTRPATWTKEHVAYADAELQFAQPHLLPTLTLPAHETKSGYHSATQPMREQMRTGNYPTLQDHNFGHSPAYEIQLGPFGRLQYDKLTKDQELAIKTGKNRRSV